MSSPSSNKQKMIVQAVKKRKPHEATTSMNGTSMSDHDDDNDDDNNNNNDDDNDNDRIEDKDDVYDIMWTNRNGILGSNQAECTVLLQVDPEDASTFDVDGASGAIGRLEVDGEGVILDMKGRQYQGRIFPGTTALILGTNTVTPSFGRVIDESCLENNINTTQQQQLKVLGMTDEFVRCVQQGDALDRLSATLEHGAGDDSGKAIVVMSTSNTTASTTTTTTTTSTVKTKRSTKKTKSK